MQVPLNYAAEFAARVNVLDTAAKELLAQRLAGIDFAAENALDECNTVMREVCGAATGKTSDLAAAFYDRVRGLYNGLPSFEALAESHLDEAALRRLIAERCSGIPPGETERLVKQLQGILGDEVVREKFTTMQANGRRDPAKPWFARVPVPSGSVYGHKPGQTHNPYLAKHGTCAFCEILASRGFVYLERATANAHVHDGCNCVPMPGFEHGRTKVGGYDPDIYVKRYEEGMKKGGAENGAGKSLRMTKAEYARVTHAINDVYHARFDGRHSGKIAVGDYTYTFRFNEFGEYEFLGRESIE